jgi:hypothetical protein
MTATQCARFCAGLRAHPLPIPCRRPHRRQRRRHRYASPLPQQGLTSDCETDMCRPVSLSRCRIIGYLGSERNRLPNSHLQRALHRAQLMLRQPKRLLKPLEDERTIRPVENCVTGMPQSVVVRVLGRRVRKGVVATAMGSWEIRAFLGDRRLFVSAGGFTKDARHEAERSSMSARPARPACGELRQCG